MDRSPQQELIDLLLTLHAVRIASKAEIKVGLIVMQKILFLSALEMRQSKSLTLSQTFYRWHYGPMSNEVYDDLHRASSSGLVDEIDGLRLTEAAEGILDACTDIFEQNQSLIEPLEKAASSVEDIDDLLEKVYDMSVYVDELDEEVVIREIPEGTNILTPLWDDEASTKFNIDPSWMETLDILLHPEADQMASRSLERAKKGKFLPLEV